MRELARFSVVVLISVFILSACGGGGGGGGSDGAGTISIAITDAKPTLPENPTAVLITFSEVLAHKSGGDWVSLPLPQTPYTIDLLQFQNGATTELVPPVELEPGTYTQIRFVIDQAIMVFGEEQEPLDLEVPSGVLRTDVAFEFPVESGKAVDLIVDFDLSRSIVVTGQSNARYKLKPVMHIAQIQDAAIIDGEVAAETFADAEVLFITVFYDANGSLTGDPGEEYTTATILKEQSETTYFELFWIVPANGYIVVVWDDINGDGAIEPNEIVYEETGINLPPGARYTLNNGASI